MNTFKLIFVSVLASTLGINNIITSILPRAQSSRASNPTVTSPAPEPLKDTVNQDISRNWSGYSTTDGVFTGVSGTWIVPQPKAKSDPGADATWVGIGGVDTSDLIQSGTQTTVDTNGQVSYEAFYETLPDVSRPLNIDIKGGDSVTVSVNQLSRGQWRITFNNNTTHQKVQLDMPYDSSLSSAEWIEEAPTGVRRIAPLNDFGKVQFIEGTAIKNDRKVTIEDSNAQPIIMANNSGEPLAIPTSIGENGSRFDVNRTDNPSIQPETERRVYRIRFRDRFDDLYKQIFQ